MKTTSSDSCAVRNAFLLVDGPNLDGAIATLLGRKPSRDDRPDFSTFAETLGIGIGTQVACKAYVTLRPEGRGAHAFLATMRGPRFGWKVEVTHRRLDADHDDPSDQAAIQALRVARERGYRTFIVVTHDHGFCPVLAELLEGGAQVTVCAFLELLHRDFDGLAQAGASIVDLRDVEPRFRHLDPGSKSLEDLIDPPDAA